MKIVISSFMLDRITEDFFGLFKRSQNKHLKKLISNDKDRSLNCIDWAFKTLKEIFDLINVKELCINLGCIML